MSFHGAILTLTGQDSLKSHGYYNIFNQFSTEFDYFILRQRRHEIHLRVCRRELSLSLSERWSFLWVRKSTHEKIIGKRGGEILVRDFWKEESSVAVYFFTQGISHGSPQK